MHKLDATMWNFLKKVLPLAFHANWMLPCGISLNFNSIFWRLTRGIIESKKHLGFSESDNYR